MRWECSECGASAERERAEAVCRECGTAGPPFVAIDDPIGEVGDLTSYWIDAGRAEQAAPVLRANAAGERDASS
jgi:hypothetical protein